MKENIVQTTDEKSQPVKADRPAETAQDPTRLRVRTSIRAGLQHWQPSST